MCGCTCNSTNVLKDPLIKKETKHDLGDTEKVYGCFKVTECLDE